MQIHLEPEIYDQVEKGTKNVEARVNDEKRQALKLGDVIEVVKRPKMSVVEDGDVVRVIKGPDPKQKLFVVVTGLKCFSDFQSLADAYSIERLYSPDFTKEQYLKLFPRFYTDEEIKKYGTVAIEFKIIELDNEIEATFLDVDKDKIREQLKQLGAECAKLETKMRRTVFDTGPNSFARVRDEGDKVVMTYKNFEDEDSITGVKEQNLTVDNYDAAVKFLIGCGLEQKAVQETLREVWLLGGAEISIDTWPWLPTFVEIEAPAEEIVWQVARELGFDKDKALFGAVDKVYNHYYGVDMKIVDYETPVINFDIDPPEWAKHKRH